jgi:hypothetical protein
MMQDTGLAAMARVRRSTGHSAGIQGRATPGHDQPRNCAAVFVQGDGVSAEFDADRRLLGKLPHLPMDPALDLSHDSRIPSRCVRDLQAEINFANASASGPC